MHAGTLILFRTKSDIVWSWFLHLQEWKILIWKLYVQEIYLYLLYKILLLIEYVICNISILKLQNYWMKNSLIFPQVALTHIWQRRWSCREHGLSSFKWVWTRSANAYKTIMNCVLFIFIATTCINTALSFNDSALLMFSTPHYITKCDCSY